jgi:hypothetical protein
LARESLVDLPVTIIVEAVTNLFRRFTLRQRKRVVGAIVLARGVVTPHPVVASIVAGVIARGTFTAGRTGAPRVVDAAGANQRKNRKDRSNSTGVPKKIHHQHYEDPLLYRVTSPAITYLF